jgi:hypothetical protein
VKYARGYSTTELARKEWDEPSFLDDITSDQLLLRFLTRSTMLDFQGFTLLASYPRSGNSLARTLLERMTGIVTGSDTRPDRNLSRELAEQHNLVGEGIVQNVAVVKTHWPERQGSKPVTARRAIVLARNPYDSIDSYWNMNATKSHNKTLTDEVYLQYREKFEALVENEIYVWHRFYKYWLEEVTIPVLLVRFEDLVQYPSRELARMLKFMLQVNELSQFWEDRIRHVTRVSTEKLGSYRPRTTAEGSFFGKSIKKGRYTDSLLHTIHDVSRSFTSMNLLASLGYDVLSSNSLEDMQPEVASRLSRRASVSSASSPATSLTINEGVLVRPFTCPFGRALTAWRHSVTNNDKNPLPIVPRNAPLVK